MFICEILLFHWYFPQCCTSDMSKYGYLEVFQKVPSTSRQRESTVFPFSHIQSFNIGNSEELKLRLNLVREA